MCTVQYEAKRKMKNMKKILAMLMALVMVFALVACDSGEKDPTVDPTTEPTVAPTNEPTDAPTEPDVTEPDVTEPDVTEPDVTEPELSETEKRMNALTAACPVEFPTMTMAVDITDVDSIGYYTGLTSAEGILEVVFNEPMMSSQAYSIVLVKLDDGVDANAIADAMKTGVNPAKWVCVEADDVMTAVDGNYVLLVMLSSDFAEALTAQDVVDAFHDMMANFENESEFVPSPEGTVVDDGSEEGSEGAEGESDGGESESGESAETQPDDDEDAPATEE